MIENTKEDIKASNRVAIKSRLNSANQMLAQLNDFTAALKKDIEIPEVKDAFETEEYERIKTLVAAL